MTSPDPHPTQVRARVQVILRLNSDGYVELLSKVVKPWVERVATERICAWQDSASRHTSGKSRKRLSENFFDYTGLNTGLQMEEKNIKFIASTPYIFATKSCTFRNVGQPLFMSRVDTCCRIETVEKIRE